VLVDEAMLADVPRYAAEAAHIANGAGRLRLFRAAVRARRAATAARMVRRLSREPSSALLGAGVGRPTVLCVTDAGIGGVGARFVRNDSLRPASGGVIAFELHLAQLPSIQS
jgi:hypothetical protein